MGFFKIIIGGSFGDEAKSKITALLAKDADIVVRYAGGPNAGHTVYYNGKKIILKLIPSGIFEEHTHCVLAQGMVINPIVFYDEFKSIQDLGINTAGRIHISEKAHVILPKHIKEDSGELSSKIGTTNRGIGPTYSDKISRTGKRLIDVCKMSSSEIRELFGEIASVEQAQQLDKFENGLDLISSMLDDTSYLLNQAIDRGDNLLFEGAQATLLDIDHGTYPYVTSSNSTIGGVFTGCGVGPMGVTDIIGISKAYVTRVGGGPFPTEINGLNGSEEYKLATWLRETGGEYGSVTGRPRRVGWLDLPALRYAKQINGFTELVLTKLDVLSGMDEIKVCTRYFNGEDYVDRLPITLLDRFKPEYITLPGWKEDISNIREYHMLPDNAKNYIQFIEDNVGLKISIVSVGPETESVIEKTNQLSFYEI